MKSKRVYWIDIYKAIAIILVIIGHSTGKFNAYIYQFHVAAFFFISGYVSKMDNEGFGKDVYKKSMTLIVPLFTMVIIYGILFKGMVLTGVYDVFYEAETEPNIVSLYKNFVSNGSTVDLLGAAWFVEVLFVSSILSHFFYLIAKKNITFFMLITVFVYLIGYQKLNIGGGSIFGIDLALLAQGYYGGAFVIKKIISNNKKESEKNKVMTNSVLFFLTLVTMFILKTFVKNECIMDLANHQIDNIWWSTIAVSNGILWLYSLSKILSCININTFIILFETIGRNTMGIMLLHFSFFRIVSWIFYKAGIASIDTCKSLVPPAEISSDFWWIYSFIAIVGSILVWMLFSKIPILSQLLGLNKSLMNTLPNYGPCKQIIELYRLIVNSLSDSLKKYLTRLKLSNKSKLIYGIVALVVLSILAFSKLITEQIKDNLELVNGTVIVEFPYTNKVVRFGNGWLPQTSDENYRWVEQESEFVICLGDQNKIQLSGYVPDGLEKLSHIKLYLNNNLIVEQNIKEEELLDIKADFAEYKVEGNNTFRIEFDSMRIPKAGDVDQRQFSAMFTSIIIE